MSDFLKYRSIENHYQSGYIERATTANQNLLTCNYVLQEKIHGANISFLFKPHEDFKVFSRNNQLDSSSNEFYGLATVLGAPEYQRLIKWFRGLCERNGYNSIRLYGELFGSNIQKGVFYGNEKRILFYDMMINDQYITITKMIDIMMCFDQVKDWFVPNVRVATSLDSALGMWKEIENHKSLLTPSDYDGENTMEGVVIKPYFEVEVDHQGNPFSLKMKNDAFLEKHKAKTPKLIEDIDPDLLKLKEEFNSYLNENRLSGVFGKFGRIKDISEIGQFLGYMMKDANEDFIKDFGGELSKYEKKSQKFVFSEGGKIISKMLKNALMENNE